MQKGMLALLLLLSSLVGCGEQKSLEAAQATSNEQNNTGSEKAILLALGRSVGSTFESGTLAIITPVLSATGETPITVNIVDKNNDNNLFTSSISNVSFTSPCAENNQASFSSATIASNTGTVTTTYQANGCVGEDKITASLEGQSVTATGTLTVSSPELGSISSIVPEHTTLAIKGFSTESLPATVQVSFSIKDTKGDPIANKEVRFSLSDTTGGLSLSKSIGYTDLSGTASTFVSSGLVNTTFRILAETDQLDSNGNTVGVMQTSSVALSVNSGLPTARAFGIGVETFNPLGWHYLNTAVDVTVSASDINNGPVANGNVISFISSAGQIQKELGQIASCTIEEGDCTVKWESGPPYPNKEEPTAFVMAYTTGEEDFIDNNSNGVFDIGETYTSLPEPYIDLNRDNTRNDGETFIDQNNNGVWDDVYNDQKYRGAHCSNDALMAGHCNSLAQLFTQTELVLSAEIIKITASTEVDLSSNAQIIIVEIQDENDVIPPVGTKIEFSCKGDVVKVDAPKPNTIPNKLSLKAYKLDMYLYKDATTGYDGAADSQTKCLIEVTTVLNGYYSHPIVVNY
ncbi:hypothetical protein SAMN02745127_02178 [Oceanospirillum multiglobuliferum]|uniref:Big-1 domain-containing protein n=1 Tax=Oceanospirillum multiglobuliferum TaxID=64969 RepID=A0A1T4R4Y8_9GAMM|nr:hypothetical protein [Oceanospirillum multiglobuliferum]OPX55229.1 hypothetical protein BTE48_09845 [Oceanospirillum multiglobuliferum]SKA11112.1 hypothetical protein SAMN02745127_02178 [Oceanospirillum multiglobuliferum]